MKNKLTFIFSFLFTFSAGLMAQEQPNQTYSFSLAEAIEFGIENNYQSRIAEKDIEIALKKKWEIIAQGLPQISGAVDYQNFLKQPVTLLPAAAFDNTESTIDIVQEYFNNVERNNTPVDAPEGFIPVRFGTKQSVNANATWSQLIFDGTYIVGIQSVQTLLQISKNAKTKTDLEIKKAVINAYGNVLLAEESVEIYRKNVRTLQKTYDDTKLIFENGLTEQEDVEQLEITLINLKNNLNRSERMRSIAYEMLNLSLGIPVENKVILTNNLNELAIKFYEPELLEENIPVEDNIDYRIAKNSAESAQIQIRLQKARALPTLTGFVNYGYQGFSDEFTFLNGNQEYFGQSILGISLNIPIFSSGMRSSRTKQREIEYEQALLNLERTENEVKGQINMARSEYDYAIENYQNSLRNLELAERIEKKNQVKFFEGIASSFELSEAQRQLYTAQQNYLQSMYNVITAKVELENLLDDRTYNDEN
ncbi:TolC family protein [Christiangramia sabulilitoris]|uniref:TolC family protein n=1 Tax=Christiangramia sabulilitoris TaxID=2583991 RepID=A0A550I8D3_9FLAO|nr:TolC family protein [Christiangramia sabulilitoris]TRO67196.1 TolC family protein [Christiangramia sabulilitoris]